MKKFLLLLALLVGSIYTSFAEEGKLKFKAQLSGRFFLDGTTYINAPDTLGHEVNIGDLRLCGKVQVGEYWKLVADVAFTRNKVSVKDAFARFQRNGHGVKIGYFFGSFGIEQSMGSCDFVFQTGSNGADVFNPGRRMGVAYVRVHPEYFLHWGVFFSDGFTNKSNTKYGYNTSLRGVWRPVNNADKLVHVGVSALFKVPDEDKETHRKMVSMGRINGLTTLPTPAFQQVVLDDVRNQIMVGTDFYVFNNKWMAQGEYMATFINQFHHKQFRAHGGYVQAGYLIRGRHYGYSQDDAITLMPYDKNSLLLAAKLNYSNLNSSSAEVWGGRQFDFTLGLNYYMNRYISTRLSYSYVSLDEHSQIGKADFHALQARFQFRF